MLGRGERAALVDCAYDVGERVKVVVLSDVGRCASLCGRCDVFPIGNDRGDDDSQAGIDQFGDVAGRVGVVLQVEVQDDDRGRGRPGQVFRDGGGRSCQVDVACLGDPCCHALEQHLIVVDDADRDQGVHDISTTVPSPGSLLMCTFPPASIMRWLIERVRPSPWRGPSRSKPIPRSTTMTMTPPRPSPCAVSHTSSTRAYFAALLSASRAAPVRASATGAGMLAGSASNCWLIRSAPSVERSRAMLASAAPRSEGMLSMPPLMSPRRYSPSRSQFSRAWRLCTSHTPREMFSRVCRTVSCNLSYCRLRSRSRASAAASLRWASSASNVAASVCCADWNRIRPPNQATTVNTTITPTSANTVSELGDAVAGQVPTSQAAVISPTAAVAAVRPA